MENRQPFFVVDVIASVTKEEIEKFFLVTTKEEEKMKITI